MTFNTSDDWLEHEDIMTEGNFDESVRKTTVLREQILDQLRRIIDPDIGKDIVACNFIKDLVIHRDSGRVDFTLELTTMACPVKDVFQEQAETYLLELDEIREVNINVTARSSAADQNYAGHENAKKHMLGVSSVIAISSGKGGVGKSSICVNLAFMLSNMGARVGIVDCDVYGPSLPTMIPVKNPQVYFTNTKDEIDRYMKKKQMDGEDSNAAVLKADMLNSGEGGMLPIVYRGVKMMSYGYLRPGAKKYMGVRGPLASSLVYQMVTQTQWGELDYLLLDLPPGTGDIHLTLGQSVPMTGAICVTTPSPLAMVDVVKGLHMFTAIAIPPLAVIENMAYLPCPNCDEEVPFDHPENCPDSDVEDEDDLTLDSVIKQFGIPLRTKLPMDRELQIMSKQDKKSNERIAPFVNFTSEDNLAYIKLKEFCKQFVREVAKARYAGDLAPSISQTPDQNISLAFKDRQTDAESVYLVPCREVRLKCRCAECVDEFSGRVKLNPKLVPNLTYAQKIKKTGNYAATFTWQDGHTSIMPFTLLESLGKQFNAKPNDSSPVSGNCSTLEGTDW